jgi:flagellar assembly protein FliH
MPEPAKRHAKILRSGEYSLDPHKFVIQTPKIFKRTKEQEIDESTQRIDELRTEIADLEKQINEKNEKADHDAEEILLKAEQEAERIVDNAEKNAFERVQKSLDDKENVILEKNSESDQILEVAKTDAQKIVDGSHTEAEDIREEARKVGFAQGMEEGFQEAKLDVQHMVERLHSIVAATLEERENILIHSERQVLNLVITMVEKVVKRLTSEEKEVVINNVKEALQLIRGSMRVYIHVNPEDYHYTIRHKEEFISMIEGKPEVKFFENPKVDRGGVYIETDTGEVDATIASQLNDIIEKIKFYMPIQVTSDISKKKITQSPQPQTFEDELNNMEAVDSRAAESAAAIPQFRRDSQGTPPSITQFGTVPKEPPAAAPVVQPAPQPVQQAPAPQPVQQTPVQTPMPVQQAPAAQPKPVQQTPVQTPPPVQQAPAAQPKPVQQAPAAQPQPAPIRKSPEQIEEERKRQIAADALKPVDNAQLNTGDVPDFIGSPPEVKMPLPKQEPPHPKAEPKTQEEPVKEALVVEAPLSEDFLNSIDDIEIPDIDISNLQDDYGGENDLSETKAQVESG